jgi:hypothetical protein
MKKQNIYFLVKRKKEHIFSYRPNKKSKLHILLYNNILLLVLYTRKNLLFKFIVNIFFIFVYTLRISVKRHREITRRRRKGITKAAEARAPIFANTSSQAFPSRSVWLTTTSQSRAKSWRILTTSFANRWWTKTPSQIKLTVWRESE